jgi:hypothetical protein
MLTGVFFLVHDADYRQSQKDFNSFVECLTEKIIEKDETIPELPPKDLVCFPSLSFYINEQDVTRVHHHIHYIYIYTIPSNPTTDLPNLP